MFSHIMFNFPEDVKKNVAYISALGFFLSLVTVISNSLSDTLLISDLGATKLPYAKFVILGICFLISVSFFKSMESLKSAVVMRASIFISSVFLMSYYFVLKIGNPILVYYIYGNSYVIYIYYFLFYYIVVPDYFLLSFEKKCMPLFFGAVALGGISGSLLCSHLLNYLSGENKIAQIYALNSLIALVATYVCHALYKNCRVIENPSDETSEFAGSLIKTIKFSPKLFENYKVAKLMAIGVVLIEFTSCIAEYLTFSIYQKIHPNVIELASFIAKLSLFQSVGQFFCATVLAYYMANRMSPTVRNLIYPVLALLCSLLFIISPGIGAAIFGSFVIRTFYDTINCTSSNINYKAINSRYANIAYILNASIISPLAIAFVSLFILSVQNYITFAQIAYVFLFITTTFVIVHFRLGKEYFISISSNIEEFFGNKNLVTANTSIAITLDYVKEKLASGSTNGVSCGLMLSASLDLSLIETEIKNLLISNHASIWRECIHFLRKKDIEALVHKWMEYSNEPLVTSALVLILLQNKMNQEVYNIIQTRWKRSVNIQTILYLIEYNPDLNNKTNDLNIDLLLSCIEISDRKDLYALILLTIAHDSTYAPLNRSKAIRLLADIKGHALGNSYIFELLQNEGEAIRAAACCYIGKMNCKELLPFMVTLMADASPLVRDEVEKSSSLFSDNAVDVISPYLNSYSRNLQEKTIATLGAIGTSKAIKALSMFVAEKHQLSVSLCHYKNLLPNDPEWLPLKIALEDSIRGVVIFTFGLLSAFGYRKTIRKIEMAFYSQNLVIRENAIEALASLPHQFLIKPLAPILNNHKYKKELIESPTKQLTTLHELALMSDNWIRVSALSVLKNLNYSVEAYEEHFIKEIERMSVLTLLKSIPLFSELSLEGLSEIESHAKYQTLIAEDIIFREGDLGKELFIIIDGEIDIVYQGRILVTLKTGSYFGEMALLGDGMRSADAVVRTKCKLLCIYQHDFIQYAMKNPTIFLDLCRAMSKTISSLNAKLSGSK